MDGSGIKRLQSSLIMTKTHTLEHYQNIVRKRGGAVLSNKYVNQTTKIKVRCGDNHEWMVRPGGLAQGSWCPECALNKRRRSVTYWKNIAEKKGGELLTESCKNNLTPLKVKCENGHIYGQQKQFNF